MRITEIRISLKEAGNGKLKAFATVTFDEQFVVRDIKVIEGRQGLFVAMPSTKVTERCRECGKKNPIRSEYCSACGLKFSQSQGPSDVPGRREEHCDVCHPITREFRHYVQNEIIEAYLEKAGAGAQRSGSASA